MLKGERIRTRHHRASARLLLSPLQKLTKQRFAIGLALWSTSPDAIQKHLKIAPDIFLS